MTLTADSPRPFPFGRVRSARYEQIRSPFFRRSVRKHMTPALPLLFVFFLCAPAGAQDLPPDMLADQYLLEATEAMEQGELQKAERAFKKIEALEIEPPPTFAYFYGKLLAEYGANMETLRKGQALLKQFVISAGRASEYYTPTLKLLSMVEAKLEAAQRAQADDAAYAEAVAQDTPEGYAAYVQRYPAGRHVAAAQAALRRLSVNAQMVRVEGGSFTMGCTPEQGECAEREKPAHRVRVSSFEISKYEVTQELWGAVMGENPSYFPDCPQCPVENVSWHDVQAFLRKLNTGGGRYRLPSEAEWEYAARGGQESRGYQHAGSNNPNAVAWHNDNSGERTHPVGQKQANEVGVYDLLGNVSEWVQDCWNDSYAGAPSDGQAWERGDCSHRVMRSSSWADSLGFSSLADRWGRRPVSRRPLLGFRLARSLP